MNDTRGIERELVHTIAGIDRCLHRTDLTIAVAELHPGHDESLRTLREQRATLNSKRSQLCERLTTLRSAQNN